MNFNNRILCVGHSPKVPMNKTSPSVFELFDNLLELSPFDQSVLIDNLEDRDTRILLQEMLDMTVSSKTSSVLDMPFSSLCSYLKD